MTSGTEGQAGQPHILPTCLLQALLRQPCYCGGWAPSGQQ